jgi:hypothetical protein
MSFMLLHLLHKFVQDRVHSPGTNLFILAHGIPAAASQAAVFPAILGTPHNTAFGIDLPESRTTVSASGITERRAIFGIPSFSGGIILACCLSRPDVGIRVILAVVAVTTVLILQAEEGMPALVDKGPVAGWFRAEYSPAAFCTRPVP